MLKKLKRLDWFLKKRKKDYTIGIFVLLISNIFAMTSPWLLGKAIDFIVGGNITGKTLVLLISGIFVMIVTEYILGYVWGYKIFYNAIMIQKDLLKIIMNKLMGMKSPFYEKYNTGDLMARATTDIQEIEELAGFGTLAIVDGIGFGLCTLLTMAIAVSGKLTLASVLPFPLMALAIQFLGKLIYERYTDYQTEFAEMNDKTLEYVSGVRVVRAYVMEERSKVDFRKMIDSVMQKLLKSNIVTSAFLPTATFFYMVCTAISIGYGTVLISRGEITAGNLISFNVYLQFMTWPMFAIGEFINIAQRGSASIERVYEVLDEKNPSDDEENEIFGDIKNISFRNYSFSYNEKNEQLSNINLDISGGQTLGIVGKTGSGKSTFLKQILKQYHFGTGLFEINGISADKIKSRSLMDKIGYVSQESILFSRSVRENIFFGIEDYDEEKLKYAIRLADFEKDIFSLPQGLDTMVGERGVAVSGGQKQRISIARALIKNPDLLILDDSLSAVDSKTEQKIIENIRKNRAGKTTLIVTHRLSAVEHADKIIVLDDGKIVEEGTHEELLKNGKWYKEQYDIQKLEDGYGI